MKTALKYIVGFYLLAVLGATLAFAQNQYIKNVIVIVQENRTPDNLFQAICSLPGGIGCSTTDGTKYNIASSGTCYGSQSIPLQARPLNSCADPQHFHADWESMYHGGSMDGACGITVVGSNCNSTYTCPANGGNETDCRQYSWVPNLLASNQFGIIQPYLDLANQYGWANFMFQTNQGPSFPAHQFLLSGTSAPNEDTPYYTWFASENPSKGNDQAGCAATDTTSTEVLISPDGVESAPPLVSAPCYEHPTLTDLLDNHLDNHGNPARFHGDTIAVYPMGSGPRRTPSATFAMTTWIT